MPLFEYRCDECGKKFATLVGMTSDSGDPVCPHCSAGRATKLVSRFARGRTEDDRIDEMADRLEAMGEPDSPSQIREMVREMGRALDEDGADDLEEIFEADMEGED